MTNADNKTDIQIFSHSKKIFFCDKNHFNKHTCVFVSPKMFSLKADKIQALICGYFSLSPILLCVKLNVL